MPFNGREHAQSSCKARGATPENPPCLGRVRHGQILIALRGPPTPAATDLVTDCTLRSGEDHMFLVVGGQVLDHRFDRGLSYGEVGCR